MTDILENALHTIAIGVGATIVLDAWLLTLKRLNAPTLNFALLGRWIGYLFRGVWPRESVARASPIRGEAALGWLAHYTIGVAFAALLFAVVGPSWMREPTVLPALVVGVATAVAPLFILQPAMGAGFASSKTAAPLLNCLRSIANHAVFGIGLYLAALATAALKAAL